MLDPSHPDTKARCAVMMIRPYKPRDSAPPSSLFCGRSRLLDAAREFYGGWFSRVPARARGPLACVRCLLSSDVLTAWGDRKRKRLIETWGTAPDPAPGGGEEEEGRKIKRERKTKKIE